MPSTPTHTLMPPHHAIRLLKWMGWGCLGIVTVFTSVWQGYVCPHINDYRPIIENTLSHSLKLPVQIESVQAGWDGLFPKIEVHKLCFDTPSGTCQLGADSLSLSVQWWAPWKAYHLYLRHPQIHLQRELDGRITLAGLVLQTDPHADPNALIDQLLEQRRIYIEQGTIYWKDLTQRTHPLQITAIDARFDNTWQNKQLRLRAQTLPRISAPIEGFFEFRPLGFQPTLSHLYGQGSIRLPQLDLAGWAPYVSEQHNPIRKGTADLQLSIDVQSGRLRFIQTQIDLKNLEGRLNKETIRLTSLNGRVLWSESGDLQRGYHGTVRTEGLSLQACDNCPATSINLETRLNYHRPQEVEEAYTKIESLHLPSVSLLAQHIPLPRAWRSQLQQRNVEGTIHHMEAYWDKPKPPFIPSRFNGQFTQLGWLSQEKHLPSVHGLSFTIQGTPNQGTLTLQSEDTRIDLPWLWDNFPALSRLEGQMEWKKLPFWQVSLKRMQLHTLDGNILFNGQITSAHKQAPQGWIDLKGSAQLQHAPRLMPYLPKVLPENVLAWLSKALIQGQGTGTWHIQGTPHHFPFVNGSKDEFMHIAVDAKQAQLHFADDWPDIHHIDGKFILHKNRIDIENKQAKIGDITIDKASAAITGIGSGQAQFSLQGESQGSLTAALAVLNHSPLRSHIPTSLNNAETTGSLKSHLTAHFPVANIHSLTFDSQSTFQNGTAHLPNIPPFTEGTGSLHLNQNGLVEGSFNAAMNHSPLQFTLTPHPKGGISVHSQGELSSNTVSAWLDPKWMAFFTGKSEWQLDAHIQDHQRHYQFDSKLIGIDSQLPAPFKKESQGTLPLHIELTQYDEKPSEWWLSLPVQGFQTRWSRTADSRQALRAHAVIGCCRPYPSLPEEGMHISGQIDGRSLSLSEWWTFLASRTQTPSTRSSSDKNTWTPPSFPLRIDLSLIEMDHFHPMLNESIFRWTSDKSQMQARLNNSSMYADMHWNAADQTPLSIHFNYLDLPAAEDTATATTLHPKKGSPSFSIDAKHPPLGLPATQITIDDLRYGNIELGKLSMRTANEQNMLHVPTLTLTHEDSLFSAEGSWNPEGMMHWQGKWLFHDTGNFLRRLNLYQGLKQGAGSLQGTLDWQGLTPLSHPKSLRGSIDLDFKKGQFTQVEPGIGKLLGLSSLQALPKRLALDFSDIFAQGFLFNSVQGQMIFDRTQLQTHQPILLKGDSANIQINGYTDLARQTQDFKIKVLPNVSGGIAAATAFFVNPLIGGAALVAQKILQDPLEKAFSYRYHISGTWDKPIIEKQHAAPKDTPTSN